LKESVVIESRSPVTTARSRPHITVTDIGEFIRHRGCERRFKLKIDRKRVQASVPFMGRFFNPLDPVLQLAGQEREEAWAASLVDAGITQLALDCHEPAVPLQVVLGQVGQLRPGTPAFAQQVKIEATIGAFELTGHIDFLLVQWRDGRPSLRLVECKASRRDQTYHHVQVALYQMIMRRMLAAAPVIVAGHPITGDDIECVVARIEEETGAIQPILELMPLDLRSLETDLEHLLAERGLLDNIAHSDLDRIPFQLNSTCDDCIFNVNCLPESARQRRLELTGIDPSTARVLRASGIASIDDLAALDLSGESAATVRATPGFTENLEQLKAIAIARSTTLPGGSATGDAFEVSQLPFAWQSQLPPHEIVFTDDEGVSETLPLTRVYLEVNYDYVENRLGALAAHVTTSPNQLHTDFQKADDRWTPDPNVVERREVGRDSDNRPLWETRPFSGIDVLALRCEEWTHDDVRDTEAERDFIADFFQRVCQAIESVAPAGSAPVHLYVWSSGEMGRLVESCERVGGGVLGHLRELLGCRESLEQLIFSSLGEEVDRRFALGWTGRGLAVAASLTWFGRNYHWTRLVGDEIVELDRVFEQDIFDFKSTLRYADGQWAAEDDEQAPRTLFEIRSRFRDTLKAPYWRARWGTLHLELAKTGQEHRAIERYLRGAEPGYLEAYLTARTHALRWIEERVERKNPEIIKPKLAIDQLVNFTLGINDVRAAAIDFLQLDQHVGLRAWVGEHLLPPASRVPRGRTIPLTRVMPADDGSGDIVGAIDLTGFDLTLEDLATMCSFDVGSFVRLTPHYGDVYRSQSIGLLFWAGSTCVIEEIDWDAGLVRMSVIPSGSATRYLLKSRPRHDVCLPYATLDENPSEFVGGRVERRLQGSAGQHVDAWLNPREPKIAPRSALHESEMQRLRGLLESIDRGGFGYEASQIDAILDGLNARIQALQGPPGTGKTTTTALAVLTRILARVSPGSVVVISANTHTAVDTLLRSMASLLPEFERKARAAGFSCPKINLMRVDGRTDEWDDLGVIPLDGDKSPITPVKTHSKDAVLVVAGTTSAALKVAGKLDGAAQFKHDGGFQTPLLIVDEASMMSFPHFLSLATLVAEDGEIMLAGDQRQLAPIVAHDWDNEDRLPVTLYRPYMSAISTVQRIADEPGVSAQQALKSSLRFTFRLPALVRTLVAHLYRRDAIDLDGPAHDLALLPDECTGWEWIWQMPTGLFLVVHDERESRQSNELEVAIIRELLDAGEYLKPGTVALVTPHRAQRTMLTKRLADYIGGPVDVVDTVEKLQGNERETIVVSGTASDPASIHRTAEFILGLNRSNVAFSRAQRRLIVVCSESLLNHIATDLEHYQEAMLWKELRAMCCHEVMTRAVNGYRTRVFVPPLAAALPG
jgi:hypothetical protein